MRYVKIEYKISIFEIYKLLKFFAIINNHDIELFKFL